MVRDELRIITQTYRLRPSRLIVNTVLQSYWKSLILKKKIRALLDKHTQASDVVFLYSYWSNDIALALSQLPNTEQIKRKIARAHGWDVYFEVNESGYLPFRKYLLLNIDYQLFISNAGKEYYTKLFPQLSFKMGVSKLGVAAQPSLSTLSMHQPLVLISCSNVIPVKRVHLIAEALCLLNDSESIEWHHFGDGPLMDSLKVKCSELLDSSPNISYTLHGRVSNKEFLHFIGNNPAHIFINVSASEGIPVSIMEAMSVGIPCIATAVGGTPELVNSGNGILLEKNPLPAEIADAINYIFSMDEERYLALRKSAYQTWSNEYNAEVNYRNFVETYLR